MGIVMGNVCITEDKTKKDPKNESNKNPKDEKPAKKRQSREMEDFAPDKEIRVDEKLLKLIQKTFKNQKQAGQGKESGGNGKGMGGNEKKKSHKVPKKKIQITDDMTEKEKNRYEILRLLDKFEKWDVNIFDISRRTGYHPLIYTVFYMLVKFDIIKKFNIEKETLIKFLVQVERMNLKGNPFSNSTHATNVLQAFVYLLKKGLSNYLCDEDIFVGILCCCVMYMDHSLLDNNFHLQNETFISTVYNDQSAQQNNSVRQFFDLMEHAHLNILANVSKDQMKFIRGQLISAVIATDTVESNSFLKEIKRSLQNGSDFSSKEDVKTLLQYAMVFCNHSYCLRTKKDFLRWMKLRLQESYVQGMVEKKMGFKVNRFGNPEQIEIEIVKFFDSEIKPLTKALIGLLPSMEFINMFLRKNKHYWQMGEEDYEVYRKIKPETSKKIDLLDELKEGDKKLRSFYGFPTDRKLNVTELEIKNETPHPTEEDKKLQEVARLKLKERWDIENSETREVITEEPKVFSEIELNLIDKGEMEKLTDEERIHAIICIYERIDDWNFDCFALTRLLNEDVLFLTSYTLFVKYDFIRQFKIPEETLIKFLTAVKDGYNRNPYHNVMHACDVMQITNSIIKKGGMLQRLTPLDMMASVVASMVHDLDHPGYNDAFQVHSGSYLAKLYNDRSVLEAHHCSKTFYMMREEGMDIFQNLTKEQRMDCRKTMSEMIISTDMSNHAKYVRAFNELIEKDSQFSKKEDIRVALQIVIKMADVSNPSRPLYLYLTWTRKIIFEFFRQGDAEKENNLPISPLMDRETSVLSKGQKAFMEYVLVPMFKSFSSVFPQSKFMVDRLVSNMKYWEEHESYEEDYFNPEFIKEKFPIEEISKGVIEGNKDLKKILYQDLVGNNNQIKTEIV